MSFVTGDYSSVTATCGVYYQGEAVRMLREFVPQLQLLCMSYGQPRISVNNETTMELNDSLVGWNDYEPAQVCVHVGGRVWGWGDWGVVVDVMRKLLNEGVVVCSCN